MDILKRELAPLTAKAWEEINDEAKTIFNSLLSARRFNDINGPKGFKYASVSLGRLNIAENEEVDGVRYGIHEVMPLIEVRVPFSLDIWELDNLERGAKEIDLDGLEKAANKLARFEEETIYQGFDRAGITGMSDSSMHEPLNYPDDPEEVPQVVSEALTLLHNASVEGPYALVVSSDKWQKISGMHKGYPLKKQIERLIGGPIIRSPFIDNGYVVSQRGGDFEMTIGQDIAIGYEHHDSKTVQLFFTESFTFRVLDDRALVSLA